MQNNSGAQRGGAPSGNQNAATTGLYIRTPAGLRQRDKRVERLARRMRLAMPWLEEADGPACRAWAELEVLAQTVYLELRNKGVLNEQGEAKRLLDDYRKLRQTQISFSRSLGMTPEGRLQINASSTTAALDLAGLLASTDITEPTAESEPENE
jgi:hypothetical protein